MELFFSIISKDNKKCDCAQVSGTPPYSLFDGSGGDGGGLSREECRAHPTTTTLMPAKRKKDDLTAAAALVLPAAAPPRLSLATVAAPKPSPRPSLY